MELGEVGAPGKDNDDCPIATRRYGRLHLNKRLGGERIAGIVLVVNICIVGAFIGWVEWEDDVLADQPTSTQSSRIPTELPRHRSVH